MPINIPASLPAAETLISENIFIMTQERAVSQDIRPLRIAILNLMPKKIETETQLLRVLSNSPIQVDVELVQTVTHVSKNTPGGHLLKFYKSFDDIRDERFDGMIITGAPVEQLPFEEVDYWEELCEMMEWSKSHVYSTFHICWGAQAGLYYHYGIDKVPLAQKQFGLFHHRVLRPEHPLLTGFDECFLAPHSRHTGLRREDILARPELELLTDSEEAGVHIIASKNGRQFFVTGHSEYDRYTLRGEYLRDRGAGLPTAPPCNYFAGDDPAGEVPFVWRSHGSLLYTNWLNYFVYQRTPYHLEELRQLEI
ncbi:homoserine O-acetyltransferase MetA [Bittarella massiliensis (ex Durand et al. 2017)]|uniref:Homoserine O-acetyltransferase n=1 Tax=Bittarella massiliensis (ex Durand et al. 2017) TaxID=1720313 RepID=A0AAW5KG57_9FIRM|nr:homoserine O-succinyltransferase [Bittarella massiliensis (ex Durand et al. 2017)]MCQ4949689.1 homoserine O-succinyltransferase [Bittarella massiliensis (ex Durand et al. 2017)]